MMKTWIHARNDCGGKFLDGDASGKSRYEFSDKKVSALVLRMVAWLEAAGNGSMHCNASL